MKNDIFSEKGSWPSVCVCLCSEDLTSYRSMRINATWPSLELTSFWEGSAPLGNYRENHHTRQTAAIVDNIQRYRHKPASTNGFRRWREIIFQVEQTQLLTVCVSARLDRRRKRTRCLELLIQMVWGAVNHTLEASVEFHAPTVTWGHAWSPRRSWFGSVFATDITSRLLDQLRETLFSDPAETRKQIFAFQLVDFDGKSSVWYIAEPSEQSVPYLPTQKQKGKVHVNDRIVDHFYSERQPLLLWSVPWPRLASLLFCK